MSVNKGEVKNKAVKEALATMIKGMPPTVTGGVFNRHMFIEALAFKAGVGVGLDENDIIKHAGMSKREFHIIKDEYIASGVIKEETNMFDVTLYSLQLT